MEESQGKTDWIAHALQTGLIKSPEESTVGSSIAQVALKEHEGHETPPRMVGEQGYPETKVK